MEGVQLLVLFYIHWEQKNTIYVKKLMRSKSVLFPHSVHLLYSPDIEKCVKKLLSIYESFQLGHVYFTNAEFDSAIQEIIQVSNEIQISYLLESIEQETLKRK